MTKKTSAPLVLTPASAWRKRAVEGELFELPSGLVVRVRPVSLEHLFIAGKVPDALSTLIADIISSGQVDTKDPISAASNLVELKRIICTSSLVSPKIAETDEPGEGEILFEWLSSDDSEAIMAWAQRPQNKLATFPEE